MPHIRKFEPGDAGAVIAVLSGTMNATWLPHMSQDARQAIDIDARVRQYVEAMGQQFIVAEHEGVVAGMVHWQDDFIHALHVAPAFQRLGIGTALLAHAEEAMVAAGIGTARLETDTFNARSRAFYTRHGYAEIDRYPDTQWNSGFTTLLLAKPL